MARVHGRQRVPTEAGVGRIVLCVRETLLGNAVSKRIRVLAM